MKMTMLTRCFGLAALVGSLFFRSALAAEHEIPPAFGPFVNLTDKDFVGSTSFTSKDRIVGTYFFYWYDIYSKSHIMDGDGTDALSTHPASLEDFSYTSVRWFKQKLTDMEAAGIDVALMVFWGSPAEHAADTGFCESRHHFHTLP